jgi:hypothetical protein
MSDSMTQMRALADTSVIVQEYAGSDALRHVESMLEALEEVYKAELAEVTAEQLVALQSKLKQTALIRKVLRKEAQLPKL